jgi:hypothetical protein
VCVCVCATTTNGPLWVIVMILKIWSERHMCEDLHDYKNIKNDGHNDGLIGLRASDGTRQRPAQK